MSLQVFDDLGGEFQAQLREIKSNTRTTVDGSSTITFRTARIECSYTPKVIKRLAAGQLLAIPNVQAIGVNDAFSIYEIADVYPMHYSMLTLDTSQPAAIRKEFMEMIQKEWEKGSKSTWIEIVGAPTNYTMKVGTDGLSFEKRQSAPLTGSAVRLLSKDAIQKLLCYSPKAGVEDNTFGNLLGVTDQELAFTVDVEKLIHYHVGVFAFTGSGKSNMTAMIVRKALKVVPDLKVVIFDVSSEYGVHLLDVLDGNPSRVIFAEPFETGKEAEDYVKHHALPESLTDKTKKLEERAERLFKAGKVKTVELPIVGEEGILRFSTYGGLVEVLSNTLNDKYGAVNTKLYVPVIIDRIDRFVKDNGLTTDSTFDAKTEGLLDGLKDITDKLEDRATLKKVFDALTTVVGMLAETKKEEGEAYTWDDVVDEILSTDKDSPRIFVVNLPEAEDARLQTAAVIGKVFRKRKRSFTLTPRVLFVMDEAQEFMPRETRKEDGTEQASRAVERLLRHGRKYHLHGWISTQRVANLNTNALQQLHSYFVSTMPRPYDRQLISDTFAIDDAFMERTLAFQNGDWLLTSFKATATQNIPVFFHAENNEEVLGRYLS